MLMIQLRNIVKGVLQKCDNVLKDVCNNDKWGVKIGKGEKISNEIKEKGRRVWVIVMEKSE